MKRFALAAALLAGTIGLALAQGGAGGAGGEPPKASDANPPTQVRAMPGEAKSAPMQSRHVKMKKHRRHKTSEAAMNSKTRKQGPESGSAKDNSSAPAR